MTDYEEYEAPTNCYCSATSHPPCGYCEGMGDCEVCGQHLKCEELKEMKDGRYLCADCYEAEREDAK